MGPSGRPPIRAPSNRRDARTGHGGVDPRDDDAFVGPGSCARLAVLRASRTTVFIGSRAISLVGRSTTCTTTVPGPEPKGPDR